MNWQPIETAPKDKRVMLYFPKRGPVFGRWDSDAYAKTPRPYWSHDNERLFGITDARKNPPTHWAPQPDPPIAQRIDEH